MTAHPGALPAPLSSDTEQRPAVSWGAMMWLALAWVGLRLVSDFPRGMRTESSLALGLSYLLLPAWLLAVLLFGQLSFPRRGRFRKIFTGSFALMGFQLLGLGRIASGFGSEGIVAGFYILLVGLSFIAMVMLAHNIGLYSRGIADVESLSRNLLWVTLPNIALGAVQLAFGWGREVDGVMRIYGMTSSPNILTAVAAVNTLGLLTLNTYLGDRPALKLAAFLWFLLAVATVSLAGIGSLLAALALFRILTSEARQVSPVRKLIGLLLALVLLGAGWVAASNVFIQRLSELGDEHNSLVWRLFVWGGYIESLTDPKILLFGGGLGYDHLAEADDAHNEYLRISVEIGVFGLILFLAPYVHSIRASLRWRRQMQGRKNARSLAAGVVAIVVFSLLNGTVEAVLRSSPSMLLGWFYIGLFVGLMRRLHDAT